MSLIKRAIQGVIKQYPALAGAEHDEVLTAMVSLHCHRKLDPAFRSEAEHQMQAHIGHKEWTTSAVIFGYVPKNPDGSRHPSGRHSTGHRVSTGEVFSRLRYFASL